MAEQFQSLAASGAPHAQVRAYVVGDHGGAVLTRWPAAGEPMPDHFLVLGAPRILCLDDSAVELKVRSLIRVLHPDRFHRDGPEAVELAQRHTALVNDAWRVLRDFEKRCQYVLDLAGDRPDEAYKPTSAELVATFERNEQLDELGENPTENRKLLRSLLGEVEGERVDVREQLRQAAELWDAAGGDASGEAAARKRMRIALGKLAYIDNLRTRIKALLDRA